MAGTDQYQTLGGSSTGEYREKGSRFLAYAFPIADEGAFHAERQRISQEHHSARHICHGWVLEPDGSRFHAFDAGEPSGTAGQPILRQLQHAGLTFCAIVVVRYFGGTLLGKPGLARAFSTAAKDALAHGTVLTMRASALLQVACEYAEVETVKHEVMQGHGTVLGADYGDHCVLQVAVMAAEADEWIAAWHRRGIRVDALGTAWL